jgi:uncharacterized protein YutE (UPF0331/DUF86 family)
MFDEYLLAIKQHKDECLEDLEQFADIAKQRSFSRMERRSAERALQVLIEACIGVAKHWLRFENKHQPLDAYDSFAKLAELQKISAAELKLWRKAIGMRNALVHDYLSIDGELLQQILAQRHYVLLSDFIQRACQAME